MDPTANLALQRGLVKEINKLAEQVSATGLDLSAIGHLADDLAEHVQALDEWISNGGFLPEQWPAPTPEFPHGVQGAIKLADGSVSQFTVYNDGQWQQWGAYRERLGRTVDFMEALSAVVYEHVNEGTTGPKGKES